jgi:transcriptional regulator with XRE-family HTH domain
MTRSRLLSRLGDNIRARRKLIGLSQEELAARTGLHRTYICDVERGARNISIYTLARVASALNVTTGSLCVDIA